MTINNAKKTLDTEDEERLERVIELTELAIDIAGEENDRLTVEIFKTLWDQLDWWPGGLSEDDE